MKCQIRLINVSLSVSQSVSCFSLWLCPVFWCTIKWTWFRTLIILVSPGVNAVLDVSDPRVLLQRVDGLQNVFSTMFYLRSTTQHHSLNWQHCSMIHQETCFLKLMLHTWYVHEHMRWRTIWVSKRELYLQHKCVVFVRHLQRHGGPHLHDSRQRDAHFGFRWLQTQINAIQIQTLYSMTVSDTYNYSGGQNYLNTSIFSS